MLRLNRLNRMEEYVLKKGTATLGELMDNFDISMNTVRRDIAELLRRGHIKKVYGGVSIMENHQRLLPISERAGREVEAKKQIGKLAAGLVEDGMTIFLDSGSTTLELLPHIAMRKNLTIVTHSLGALYEAAKYPSFNIINPGGQYLHLLSSYVGLSTLQALSHISIDMVFIAATGVTLENGLANNTYMESEIKRGITQKNKHIALMADHSKFGKTATYSFCELEDLKYIITDTILPNGFQEFASANGITVLT